MGRVYAVVFCCCGIDHRPAFRPRNARYLARLDGWRAGTGKTQRPGGEA